MRVFITAVLAAVLAIATVCPAYAQENKYKELPDVECKAGILIDAESGRILWEKNSHETLAMASTTKIMTALLAIERCNQDEIVTVSKRAALTPPVKMGLTSGEKITISALLYALMMQSSNDAAVAIAEHIAGSVEEFCNIMTIRARELGALDTVYETPNGLDSDEHYSTAYDLARISSAAMKNLEFSDLISTPEITVKSDKREYHIMNKNRFLNEFEGANGIKTGYTGGAGHCFVGAASKDGMQLISVVLASGWGTKGKEQKWIDTKKIMKYGFSNYKKELVFESGEPAASVPVARAKEEFLGVCYSDSQYLPIKEDERDDITILCELPDKIVAPVLHGDIVGEARIYVAGKYTSSVDLFATTDIMRHDFQTSLQKCLSALMYIISGEDTQ